MKQFLLVILFVLSIASSYGKDKGPKVDIKEDTILVDGKPNFVLEKVKSNFPPISNFYIKELNGKKLAFIQYNDKYGENYYVFTFLESKQTAETRYIIRYKSVAEYLLESKLVQNGTITKESEDEFILVNGNSFSSKYNNNGNTIIINNSNPTPRNGVQFNIGN